MCFFFRQERTYDVCGCLVGSEMCKSDRIRAVMRAVIRAVMRATMRVMIRAVMRAVIRAALRGVLSGVTRAVMRAAMSGVCRLYTTEAANDLHTLVSSFFLSFY